jgi:BNR/Asp-box repeat
VSTVSKTGEMGARRRRRCAARLLTVHLLAAACVVLGLTALPALAAPASGAVHARAGSGYHVSPVTKVSTCGGGNAEVVQAVGKPGYVYEAWIGCGGEGFARSADGGLHFQKPLTLPDSSGSDDPAIAVAPNGTVYVSYLRYHKGYAYPVVAASFDHGATFPQVRSLIPHVKGNWGDRDFIAAGRNGTVYVTWDYGPSAADVKIICSPVGSCAYEAVDATAVIQRSADSGKTWSKITPMQPGFPAGGGYDASVLVQPDGRVDALVWGHHLNPVTFKVHPGHEFFTSSSDAGRTWSPLLKIGPRAGSIAVPTWWIDGNLGMDRAGILYATWDTQTARGDIGWLSYSTDHGRTWSAPVRVTSDHDNAMHNVEVAGAAPGVADVAWQADNSPLGYATYLRPFSITRGWLAPATRVSPQFGNKKIWPGDTFGISVLAPDRVVLSWGSAIKNHKNSQIYARVVRLPRHA